jgi:digeranylgeranylglycerophospholipid reductase
MREEKHDVVVVGAGPAGSLTAKTAAEKGLDVLLIERNQEIGVPVRCAEGTSKEIEKLVKVDKKWICAEIKGANIYAPDGTKVALSAEGVEEAGYVLERRIFDKFLAREAVKTGAEVRVKTHAYGIVKEEGHAKGVYARCMGEDIRIFADLVVGADGVESRVGRWVGIDTRLRPSDIETCAEFFMTNIELDKDYCEFFLGDEIAPKGYAWIFPKGEDCANVGLGIGGDVSDEDHRAIDYLKAFAREKFPSGKTIAEMYGAVPVGGPISESVADGVILVGDAARQINPLSGGGILYAMKAGIIAGEVIAKAVQEKDFSKKRLSEYEKRWKHDFGKSLEKSLKAKEFFLNKSSEELNNLAHSMGEIKLKELSTRAFLKEMVKKNPKLLFELAKMLL